MMKSVLAGLLGRCVFIFVDDTLIFSPSRATSGRPKTGVRQLPPSWSTAETCEMSISSRVG